MPTHTSDSSASAGHPSSWATVTGGSRHQSQRRIDTCLLCYALHQGKHKQVRLVLSLSVFYLHSAASKKEVVKGSQLHMLLMCLVKVVWRAQTCAHRHSQNTYRILLQAQGILAHTQPCLARGANLREESWTRFVVLQLSLVSLSVSYFVLCSIAA